MSSLDLERIHLVKPYGPTTAIDRIDLRIDGGRYSRRASTPHKGSLPRRLHR